MILPNVEYIPKEKIILKKWDDGSFIFAPHHTAQVVDPRERALNLLHS